MKRITKIVALAAIALFATAAVANATVTVTDGVGYIGKGDVQNTLLLKNDAALQDLFQNGGINFGGGTVTFGNETRWTCSGSVQSQTSLVTDAVNVSVTPALNNGGKVTGWNATGRTVGSFISGKRIGALYVGYCPAGETFVNFVDSKNPDTAYDQFTTTYSGGLTVNGVDLPNTPAVAPTV
jgi:hypothetical protein